MSNTNRFHKTIIKYEQNSCFILFTYLVFEPVRIKWPLLIKNRPYYKNTQNI